MVIFLGLESRRLINETLRRTPRKMAKTMTEKNVDRKELDPNTVRDQRLCFARRVEEQNNITGSKS